MKTTPFAIAALRRWSPLAALAIASLAWSGCATDTASRFSPEAVAAMTPTAEVVQPLDALHLAEQYVADHPGTEYMIGSGESMMPVYKDHTVIITQRISVSELKPGMTVVFVGDRGFPVAHALVAKSADGWIAMGVGNAECDQTRVREDNYLGAVVKAYEPTSSPMLALLGRSPASGALAAMR